MDSCFLFDNTALRMLCIGLGVLAHHVDTLHDGAVFLGDDLENLSGLALVIAGVHIDHIAFLDM